MVGARALGALISSLAVGLATAGGNPPTTQPAPDERLWQEIEMVRDRPVTTQPYVRRLEAEMGRSRQLVRLLREYQVSYPGGRRRDAAVALELEALYSIAARTGEFGALCERARDWADEESGTAAAEGSYWLIQCALRARVADAETVATRPVDVLDADERARWWGYLAGYPQSRHAIRIAMRLYADADARDAAGDRGRVRAFLEAHHPDAVETEYVAGLQRRVEAIGEPFSLVFDALRGTAVDTVAWRGRSGVVLVWGTFDSRSTALLQRLDALVKRGAVAGAGVALDTSQARLRARLDELSIALPQHYDGLGRAGAFARRWAVGEIPLAFEVDSDGVLVGIHRGRQVGALLERLGRN